LDTAATTPRHFDATITLNDHHGIIHDAATVN
jgi:hypothetical protein